MAHENMPGESRFVVRTDEARGYAPANHHGTTNYRVIGSETVGAENLEVSIGVFEPGGSAEYHAHPVEQVLHLVEGEAEATIEGETFPVRPGDWVWFPTGAFHAFKAVGSTPLKVIVIYSPPLQRHQDEVVVRKTAAPDGPGKETP